VRDQNVERRAVKQVFEIFRRNLQLMAAKPTVDEAQLALEWTATGDWLALDDLSVQQAEAQRYNKRVKECVAYFLSAQEAKIIKQSYMSVSYSLPWQIYEPMHIERTTYYALKAKAIGKLYIAFRLQRLLQKSAD